jgi:hypothetical protein
MRFQKVALRTSCEDLQHSSDYEDRALCENVQAEENICENRQNDFEDFSDSGELKSAMDAYFGASIQGNERGHLPSTFDLALNAPAILPATLEQTNKIIRLEKIDKLLANDSSLDYAKVKEAFSPRGGNLHIKEQFMMQFEMFSGERPAFACFKHEVEDDLRQTDWLPRLIDRLGLYHSFPLAPGMTYSFALMEYTVKEVFKQAEDNGISRPMAIATVLECQRNPAFYPAPADSSCGFTVDLSDPPSGLPSVREFLNIRLDYRKEHVLRFGQLPGPHPRSDLATCRRRHADGLARRKSATGDLASNGDGGR